MNTAVAVLDLTIAALRPVFFAGAVVVAVVCAADWLVRTRRINPFNPVARFFRKAVDPLLAPVEHRVVRAGGLPANAPWWGLAVVVVGGILLLSLLGFVRTQLVVASMAAGAGPAGIYQLVVRWAIAILQLAIIVRIVASLLRLSPYSPFIRWSFTLSEPILRPLRGVIPPLGMFDITPIVAYFLLNIVEWLLLLPLRL